MHSISSSCPLSHLSSRVVSCPLESACFEEIEYVSRPIAALLPLTLTSPFSPPACQWSPSLLLPKTAYSQSTWPRQTLQTSSPGSSPSQRRTTRSLYVSVSLSAGRGRARASGSLCQLGFLRFPRRDPGLTILFIPSSLSCPCSRLLCRPICRSGSLSCSCVPPGGLIVLLRLYAVDLRPSPHLTPLFQLEPYNYLGLSSPSLLPLSLPYADPSSRDRAAQSPGKNVRSQMVEAFNLWLKVDKDELRVINKVVGMLHTSSLLCV